MIRELVRASDPILRQVMHDFDFANPATDPIELARDLAETMISENGIGLAANQLGFPFRAFAMMGEKIIVCFNPKIVDVSEEQVTLEEGCLSYKGMFVKIKRPKRIKVRYTEPNGNVVTKTFDGITARVFQHEKDHLDGICHINRANRFHATQAKNKLKKAIRNDKQRKT